MAVVRITAPKRWHRKATEALADFPRAKREFARAMERPGLTAELRGDEIRALVKQLPKDARALEALKTLEECEAREAARPRARDIALGRVQRYG